ncbi:GNAT family N-acetyltransferase [Lampropedia aestuarii]|uniref:GNAT family N-acetyltransferase n=1 Tax=Lampropedia aestuarii TaxID=2562762 RepID=UPI0024696664|nr:GNAT family protein [Lampropedia aestuarii]MDH5855737.1 GNAT family protein [Lampropedia aestuarii]
MTTGSLRIHTEQASAVASKAGMRVHIETPNLITRTLRAADVTQDFVQWFNDPQMLQGLNLPALHFSVDGLRAFVASFDNVNHFLIGIFDKKNNRLLGFYNFTVNPQHGVATLTLGADPKIKIGREILKESWTPLCDHIFNNTKIEKITSRVLSNNKKLLFVLIDAKYFVYEGILKKEILGKNGKRLDVMVLSCFKDPSLRPNTNQVGS